MRTQFGLSFYLFWLGLFFASVLAQPAQTNQAALNRQVALDTLAQLRASVDGIENECQKIRAQMQLADVLWTREEMQARQLFEDAFKLAFEPGAKTEQEQCPVPSRNALGFEVLHRIAQHNAEWASRLVEALPESTNSPTTTQHDLKTRLRQSLATRLPDEKTENGTDLTTNNGAANGQLIRAAIFGAAPTGSDPSVGQNSPVDFAPLSLLSTPAAMSQPIRHPQFDATQAIFNGDFKQAQSLIEKISDPQMRQQFDMIARVSQISTLSAAGNEAEALQRALEISPPSQRVGAFVNLARTVRSKRGAIRAMEILLLAKQSLDAEKESSEKAQALLMLAEVMIELDLERAFDLAQIAVSTINSVSGQTASVTEINNEVAALGQILAQLSQSDFARVWGLAMSISNRDLAWFTKLALCRGMLTEEKDKGKADKR